MRQQHTHTNTKFTNEYINASIEENWFHCVYIWMAAAQRVADVCCAVAARTAFDDDALASRTHSVYGIEEISELKCSPPMCGATQKQGINSNARVRQDL